MGNANPYIYYEGYHARFAPHYAFYDVTAGAIATTSLGKYGLDSITAAGEGYDRVTGWGFGQHAAVRLDDQYFCRGDSPILLSTPDGPAN